MYYEIYGEGESLVLIAGLGGDHTIWYPVVEYLKKFFQVIIFDNRGVGQTDSPDILYTTELMAEDTAELLKFLKIKNAFVLGHSMGGLIAQQLFLNHPELVDKLILYSSYAKFTTRTKKLIDFTSKFFKYVDIDTALNYLITQTYSDKFLSNNKLVEQTLESMKQNPHPQTPIGYFHQFEASCLHDTRSKLHLLKVPTLVLGGETDLLPTKEEAFEMYRNIPGAKIKIFNEVAHVAHLELPSEFSECLHNFLNSDVKQ